MWKTIEGYEGLYEVNSLGEVRSLDRSVLGVDGAMYSFVGKIKSQSKNCNTGYLYICLYKNNVGKTSSVHRLVAQAFIDNPNSLPMVNHIDGDKTNNTFANLEWCNASENQLHAIKTGLRTITRAISDDDLLELVYRVIQGERLIDISKGSTYCLSSLSTGLVRVAKDNNLSEEYSKAMQIIKSRTGKEAGARNKIMLAVKIEMLTKEGEYIRSFNSLKDAARFLGKKSSGTISNALNPDHPQKTAYGYCWRKA